jgi:hypothetical protein
VWENKEIQEQAGHMWQEFEKRMQALDDARQALEDRISRQIDSLLSQQRSFARRVEAMAVQPTRTRVKAASRKTATKKSTAKRPAKRSSSTKASARRGGAKRSAAKRSPAKRTSSRRSTAKTS